MKKNEGFAEYLTIKKTIEVEESFSIIYTGLTVKELKTGLLNGEFNIIQNNILEPYMWVVDTDGKRIAHLHKDGGCGPDEKVKIITG